MIVGLAFCFSNNTIAQQNRSFDLIINAAMVEAVNHGKEYYKKGMDLNSFVQSAGNDVKRLSPQELALVTDVYNFIKDGTSSAKIIETYNGVSLKNIANTKAFESYPDPIKGKKCNFWCIIKLIKSFLELILTLE